jgi:hypothetical protein
VLEMSRHEFRVISLMLVVMLGVLGVAGQIPDVVLHDKTGVLLRSDVAIDSPKWRPHEQPSWAKRLLSLLPALPGALPHRLHRPL